MFFFLYFREVIAVIASAAAVTVLIMFFVIIKCIRKFCDQIFSSYKHISTFYVDIIIDIYDK